jgi:hypothetical protein
MQRVSNGGSKHLVAESVIVETDPSHSEMNLKIVI